MKRKGWQFFFNLVEWYKSLFCERLIVPRSRWMKTILLAIGTLLIIYGRWVFISDGNLLAIGKTEVVQNVSNLNQNDAQNLLQQGRQFYNNGQFSEAIRVLHQSSQKFKQLDDVVGEATALGNISLAYKKLSQLEKAYDYITNSRRLLENNLNISDSNKRLKILAQILDIQGLLQLELGKAEQAIETWKQAINNYTRLNDQAGITRCLINQSLAQQTLGYYRQSRKILEQVNQNLQKQPDSLVKVTALRSLGDVLQLVGELESSLKILQQSQDIAKKLQSPTEQGEALLSLGNTQRALGKRLQNFTIFSSLSPESHSINQKPTPLQCRVAPSFDENRQSISQATLNRTTRSATQRLAEENFIEASNNAFSHYQQAVEYYQKVINISTSPTTQLQAKINLFSLLIEQQEWSQAQNLLPKLESQLKNIPISQITITANINFAQNLTCLKQATTTNTYSWEEIAKRLVTAIKQAENLDEKRLEAYALGVLARLYLESPQNITYAQSLTTQALIKAQAIEAADIVYLWQWQLGHIFRIKNDSANAIKFYTESVNTLKYLRNDLAALNPDIQFSFREGVEPVYRQLVDLLLLPNTSEKNSQSFVNQNNIKQARDIIEALQLTELENFFREACLLLKPKQIDEVVDKTDTKAAVIYPIILPNRLEVILKLPTQSQLRHYTIHKSEREVDKILEQLQHNLREPDTTKVVQKLSGQVYSWLIEPLVQELAKANIKTLVFVLDGSLRNIPMSVLYNSKQKYYLLEKYAISIAPGLQLIDPRPLQRAKIYVLAGGVSEKRQVEGRNFSQLNNVRVELQQIQSKIPNSRELLNQNFTQLNLKNQIKSDTFSVVHLATHGEFSSSVDKTFILTWEQLLKVKDFDSLLRLGTQRDSRNAIELLVLSACQTAAGDKRAALGLAGIAVRAGARSTLGTLWSVDDASTAELMGQFYQELDNTTITKVEALRRAQLSLLNSYKDPFFWAPYILVGNWL